MTVFYNTVVQMRMILVIDPHSIKQNCALLS